MGRLSDQLLAKTFWGKGTERFQCLATPSRVLGFAVGRFYMKLHGLRVVASSSMHGNDGIGRFCYWDVRGLTIRIAFQRGSVEQINFAKETGLAEH